MIGRVDEANEDVDADVDDKDTLDETMRTSVLETICVWFFFFFLSSFKSRFVNALMIFNSASSLGGDADVSGDDEFVIEESWLWE